MSVRIKDSNVSGKINLGLQTSFYSHRSGWDYVVHNLSEFNNPNGIYFDGFIEIINDEIHKISKSSRAFSDISLAIFSVLFKALATNDGLLAMSLSVFNPESKSRFAFIFPIFFNRQRSILSFSTP